MSSEDFKCYMILFTSYENILQMLNGEQVIRDSALFRNQARDCGGLG